MSKRNLWITCALGFVTPLLLRAFGYSGYKPLLVIWALIPVALLIFYFRTGRIVR